MIARRMSLVAAILTVAASTTGNAQAGGPLDGKTEARPADDAQVDFSEGTTHFQAGRWPEALTAFERAQRTARSPNAELMIARCLRELGRRVEAASAFERAAEEARARVAEGETRYAPTADAADAEGGRLRAQLAVLRVHVANPEKAALVIDGKPVRLPPAGDLQLLREPGPVDVVIRDGRGVEQRQSATLPAGASTRMDFVVAPDPTSAGTTATPNRAPPSWSAFAAATSGVVTVGGLSIFTVFGLRAQSTYDALSARCGPNSCGPADRDEADSGARDQTIANIGLITATVAGLAAIAFVVIHLSSDRGSTTSAR